MSRCIYRACLEQVLWNSKLQINKSNRVREDNNKWESNKDSVVLIILVVVSEGEFNLIISAVWTAQRKRKAPLLEGLMWSWGWMFDSLIPRWTGSQSRGERTGRMKWGVFFLLDRFEVVGFGLQPKGSGWRCGTGHFHLTYSSSHTQTFLWPWPGNTPSVTEWSESINSCAPPTQTHPHTLRHCSCPISLQGQREHPNAHPTWDGHLLAPS